MLQSKGLSSGGRQQPFDESRKGHGTSSSGLSVLYNIARSIVILLRPVCLNLASGKSDFNCSAASFVKTGVSQRLCLRKEQQNLQDAQSDFFKIADSTVFTPQNHKIFQESLQACKITLLFVNLQRPYLLHGLNTNMNRTVLKTVD